MVQKAEAKKGVLIVNPSPRHKRNASTGSSRSASPEDGIMIPRPLNDPLQDIAVTFLLGDYIRGSHFDYLPALYEAGNNKKLLSPIVMAVANASLYLQTSEPALLHQARRLYVEAISITNQALQDPLTARKDEVLGSILLLALYETLNTASLASTQAWEAHMQGALSVLALRGPEQFETRFGLDMYKQVVSGVRFFCVQRQMRGPPILNYLQEEARRRVTWYPGVESVTAISDLCADIKEGFVTEPEDIIDRAEKAIKVYSRLQTNIPDNMRYDTITDVTSCSEIYGDFCYRFQDHHVASWWNTNWMGHVYLYNMIDDQLQIMSDTAADAGMCNMAIKIKQLECQKAAQALAEQICATVPQFFPPADGGIPGPKTTKKAAEGYFLIWPLFTIGLYSILSSKTKEYAVNRLEYIGLDLKLPQALVAADMLKQPSEDEEHWGHIYHIF